MSESPAADSGTANLPGSGSVTPPMHTAANSPAQSVKNVTRRNRSKKGSQSASPVTGSNTPVQLSSISPEQATLAGLTNVVSVLVESVNDIKSTVDKLGVSVAAQDLKLNDLRVPDANVWAKYVQPISGSFNQSSKPAVPQAPAKSQPQNSNSGNGNSGSGKGPVNGGKNKGRNSLDATVPMPNAGSTANAVTTISLSTREKFVDLWDTKTYKAFMKFWTHFESHIKQTKDPDRSFVDIMSKNMIVQLVTSEVRLKTSPGITEGNLPDFSNLEIKAMVARLLRPKSTDEYKGNMIANIKPPFSKEHGWVLGCKDFHVNFSDSLRKFITDVVDHEEFVRLAISTEEAARLPAVEWGKSDNPGAIRVWMACLGVYEDGFNKALREPLMRCTTLKEWETFMLDKLQFMTDLGQKIADEDARLTPDIPIKECKERAKAKQTQKKLFDTSRDRGVMVRARPTFRLLEEKKGRRSMNDSSDEENVFDEEDDLDSVKREQEYIDSMLLVLSGGKKPDPNPKNRACFSHYAGLCQAGKSCLYSHEPEIMRKYAASELEKYLKSEFADPQVVGLLRRSVPPARPSLKICSALQEDKLDKSDAITGGLFEDT